MTTFHRTHYKLTVRLLIAFSCLLGGCASGPYYYGSTGYRLNNIGNLPVSGSIGVAATSAGVTIRPNIYISPYYRGWEAK